MTKREVKAELINVRLSQKRYMLCRDKVSQFRDMIACSGVSFESGGGSANKRNSTEEKLIKLISYEEECKQYEKDMVASRDRAECMISLLKTPNEKEVITRRYMFCESWEEIAVVMNYTVRALHKIHDNALYKISCKLK